MIERAELSEIELTMLECDETNEAMRASVLENPLKWLIDTHPEMLPDEVSDIPNAA